MRYRTRSYTGDAPCIDLKSLAHIRRTAAGDTAGLRQQNNDVPMVARKTAEGYAIEINGTTITIRTTLTQAGYGHREWYVCSHCGGRVAKLYLGYGEIACRECFGLHYRSQSEGKIDRMARDVRRQRYAIWGDNEQTRNLLNKSRFFPKPKGVRQETFNRKLSELMEKEREYWLASTSVMEGFIRRCL